MPTSNQTTDTNNNNDNKISTRSPAELPAVGVGVGVGVGGPNLNNNHSMQTSLNNNNNIMIINQTPSIIKHNEQLNNQQQLNLNVRNTNSITNHNSNNNTNIITNNHSNNHNSLHQNNNNNYHNNHHQYQYHYQNQHQQQNQTLTNQQHQRQQQQQQQQTQQACRSLEELTELIKDINFDRTSLTNEELIKLVKKQLISVYKLESFLGKDNAARCVEVRRDYYRLELAELDRLDLINSAKQKRIGITNGGQQQQQNQSTGGHQELMNGDLGGDLVSTAIVTTTTAATITEDLFDSSALYCQNRAHAFNHPRYEDLEYEKVNGACCENVIGHVKVPVGIAGPLVLDGEEIYVPLATTEGCLVASTCRGLSALRKSGGVSSRVRKDFMTRAPIIRFHDANLGDALDNVERAIAWLNDKTNMEKMRAAFNLTSSHGKFLNYTLYPVSREIHIRFEAQTGDAMGMNMCSKGVESALKKMQCAFPTMEIVTLSGNMCTDKKAAGINWINGRGKSVECNAELPAQVVQQVFKVSVDSMIDRWKSKVMVGSALAASIGGFNSQAANILTAIFIATGQDPAQNVTSSNCMLILEKDSKGSLVVCCTMPSIECGTVGGGTILGDQSRYLQMMGVKGPTPKQYQIDNNNLTQPVNQTNGYTNARKLARIICATVMAGELSLLAALTEGTLVKSHMRHNRSSTNVTTSTNSASSTSICQNNNNNNNNIPISSLF